MLNWRRSERSGAGRGGLSTWQDRGGISIAGSGRLRVAQPGGEPTQVNGGGAGFWALSQLIRPPAENA
jgi:hypothetical protein